jgi:hypothetical protein
MLIYDSIVNPCQAFPVTFYLAGTFSQDFRRRELIATARRDGYSDHEVGKSQTFIGEEETQWKRSFWIYLGSIRISTKIVATSLKKSWTNMLVATSLTAVTARALSPVEATMMN